MTPFCWLGAAGIVAIEGSYVPQIVRLFRLKRAEDVSHFFPLLNASGRVLALLYALSHGETVFVGGFFVGIVLRLVLLGQVLWYRTRSAHRLEVLT